MKKLAIFFAITLMTIFSLSAQSPCLSDGIYFHTQQQIDSFQVNYPGCTEIEGNVQITGVDITNLNGLNVLNSFGGNLSIIDNDGMTSLTGLGNLSFIKGRLLIDGHDSLPSLNGLDNLSSVGSLTIMRNLTLTSLGGLTNLSSIGQSLYLINNNSLISLEGLENIDEGSLENITIFYNILLSECHIQSICAYLSAPNGTISIHDNAPGCNNPEEVIAACEAIGIDEQRIPSLTIHPNPSENGFITTSLENTHNKLLLTIFNTFGQQVHSEEVHCETVINVSDWKAGIYLAVVYEDGKPVGRAKFVVQ